MVNREQSEFFLIALLLLLFAYLQLDYNNLQYTDLLLHKHIAYLGNEKRKDRSREI